MQIRFLASSFRDGLLSVLGAAMGLCVMLPFPAAAQQKGGDADRSAESPVGRKQPPTILATPPFFIDQLPPPAISCSAVNLASTPIDVTITLVVNDINNNTPPRVATITLQPNAFSAFGPVMFGPQGTFIPPLRAFCKFEASDVTLIRASASVADGGLPVPQFSPAN